VERGGVRGGEGTGEGGYFEEVEEGGKGKDGKEE
jgi:hypothetical protein